MKKRKIKINNRLFDKEKRKKKKERKKLIKRKNKLKINQMKLECDLLVKTHKEIAKMIKPGITTMEIDTFVEEFLAKHGATPEQKGFQGYEYATCASINDEICHGFPRNQKLVNGDIVTIDM